MAEAILDDSAALAPTATVALNSAVADGRAILADPAARTPTLRAQATLLAQAITIVLRAAGPANDERRQSIERTVVELSADKIAVDRAWHLPQGLDGDPDSVLPLDQALGLTEAGRGDRYAAG
jgi:hypothetical protein